MSISIYTVQENQIDQASSLLAAAFQCDPLFVQVFSDAEDRARLLPWFFGVDVRYACRFGLALAVGEPLAGVANWLTPDEPTYTEDHLEAVGASQAPEVLGREQFKLLLDIGTYIDAQFKPQLPDRYWMCETIGVDQAVQGSGIGSALLDTVHERSDQDGNPCALWTTQPRAVPFYLRRGYDLVCEGTEPQSGLSFWGFMRTPQ
ncbi:MAG: GNAT family N-acetyltransferase [Thermomicrobiales bacterium]